MTLWRNFQRRVTSDILKISCQSQTKAKPNVASSHAFPARYVRRLRIIASDWFTLFPASDVTGQINNLCFGDVIGDVYTAPDEFLTGSKIWPDFVRMRPFTVQYFRFVYASTEIFLRLRWFRVNETPKRTIFQQVEDSFGAENEDLDSQIRSCNLFLTD